MALMEGPRPRIDRGAGPARRRSREWALPEYEALLAGGRPGFAWMMPDDEWESLALNYTSGTTGRPKGVVYHHRGAYLMTMGTVVAWRMVLHPRLPDHRAAVSLQRLEPRLDDAAARRHARLLPRRDGEGDLRRHRRRTRHPFRRRADRAERHRQRHTRGSPRRSTIWSRCSPPAPRRPPRRWQAIEPLGFNVTQVYGLTETYGHVTECLWQGRWDALTPTNGPRSRPAPASPCR